MDLSLTGGRMLHARQRGLLVDTYVPMAPSPGLLRLPRVFVPAGDGWQRRAEIVAAIVSALAVSCLETEEDDDEDE